MSQAEPMTFEEAMIRARAAHVAVESFRQPGNDYRAEIRCSCRAHVWASGFEQHIVDAADALVEGRELRPTMHGLSL